MYIFSDAVSVLLVIRHQIAHKWWTTNSKYCCSRYHQFKSTLVTFLSRAGKTTVNLRTAGIRTEKIEHQNRCNTSYCETGNTFLCSNENDLAAM